MMSLYVTSWREVIKRRYKKDMENNTSLAAEDNKEEVNNVYYPVDNENPVSREFVENDIGANFVSDPYPLPGTNQTIVCQVISG